MRGVAGGTHGYINGVAAGIYWISRDARYRAVRQRCIRLLIVVDWSARPGALGLDELVDTSDHRARIQLVRSGEGKRADPLVQLIRIECPSRDGLPRGAEILTDPRSNRPERQEVGRRGIIRLRRRTDQ